MCLTKRRCHPYNPRNSANTWLGHSEDKNVQVKHALPHKLRCGEYDSGEGVNIRLRKPRRPWKTFQTGESAHEPSFLRARWSYGEGREPNGNRNNVKSRRIRVPTRFLPASQLDFLTQYDFTILTILVFEVWLRCSQCRCRVDKGKHK